LKVKLLATVGDLVEDVIIWPTGSLTKGADNDAQIFRTPGGSAANVARMAATINPSRFIGCVGDDGIGIYLESELSGFGVDVRLQRRGATGAIVILIEADGERTMFPNRGASTLLEDVNEQWLDGVSILHFPAYSFDGQPIAHTSTKLAHAMKQRGGRISIDASSTSVINSFGVGTFLELIQDLNPDIFFANEAESELLGLHIPEQRERILSAHPTTLFVLKAGPENTHIFQSGQEVISVPVPPVEGIRDTTGAGDAFAAGFLSALLSSSDVQAACQLGHSTAATVLKSPGATVTGLEQDSLNPGRNYDE
jgi:sugar/nucleoside kinase (ribokinase family)